jgi:hypothetical protein
MDGDVQEFETLLIELKKVLLLRSKITR